MLGSVAMSLSTTTNVSLGNQPGNQYCDSLTLDLGQVPTLKILSSSLLRTIKFVTVSFPPTGPDNLSPEVWLAAPWEGVSLVEFRLSAVRLIWQQA